MLIIRNLLGALCLLLSLPVGAVTLTQLHQVKFDTDADLVLAYSGNQDGELEPCGCSVEGNSGGILRQSTALKALRAQTPDMFTISSGGLISSMVAQDRLTAEHILKGYAELNYDAIGVQWSDLAYGAAFVSADGLPWVASNMAEQFSVQHHVERGGLSLAMFSWLDPSQDPAKAMQADQHSVTNDVAALSTALRLARESGALTVLTTTLSLKRAQAELPLEWVDILFMRAAYEEYGEPRKVGDTLVLEPGSRGMRLGYLQLRLNKAGRIDSWLHQAVSMPPEVADDAALKPWYDQFSDAVRTSYEQKVALRKKLETGISPFVGEETCQSCHQTEHAVWNDSLHSNAFAKLEQVNKAFDPSCIQCHVVGFETEGGFIDPDSTPQLMNVQCENCHGAGRAHAESQGREPLAHAGWQAQQMCQQCHVQKHSPSFKFENYWPRIQHGQQAQP